MILHMLKILVIDNQIALSFRMSSTLTHNSKATNQTSNRPSTSYYPRYHTGTMIPYRCVLRLNTGTVFHPTFTVLLACCKIYLYRKLFNDKKFKFKKET
jgi:hypothetical protein